jgi:hypothetical protein
MLPRETTSEEKWFAQRGKVDTGRNGGFDDSDCMDFGCALPFSLAHVRTPITTLIISHNFLLQVDSCCWQMAAGTLTWAKLG